MNECTDQQLLERFRRSRDRDAINELARRYIGLVYSAARRQVRDEHLAADVTQAVFIVLVQKADSIRRDTVLPAWLFTVTRHAAMNAIRVRDRQRFHEKRKMLMSHHETVSASESIEPDLLPHLDDAIARLPTVERSSVILHFFEHRTHKQVGEALGLTEEAARKRVTRGIERMRQLLELRGVTGLGASAAPLAVSLAREGAAIGAAALPAGLLESSVNVALVAGSFTCNSSAAFAIAKGVSHVLTMTKVKAIAAAVAAVMVVGGAVTPIVTMARSAPAPRPIAHLATALIETRNQPAPAAQQAFSVEVDKDTRVQIVGVSSYPMAEDTWFAANGEPIEIPEPRALEARIMMMPAPQNAVVLRIERPATSEHRVLIRGSASTSTMNNVENNVAMVLSAFHLQVGENTAAIEVGFSEANWQTVAANESPADAAGFAVDGIGQIEIDPVDGDGEESRIVLHHPVIQDPNQVIVIDADGKEHVSQNINENSDGAAVTKTCTFKLGAEQIRKVLLQTRPFTKFVDIENISLEKGQTTEPKLTVREAKKD